MAMATLLQYHTVAGMLLPVNNSVIEDILKRAATQVGDTAWRAGFSGFTKGGQTEVARSHLELAGIRPKAVTGALSSVKLADTKDGTGNVFHKVRVGFDGPEGNMLVSLDAHSEIAQRLAQKLLNAAPGEVLSFLPFSTLVEKGGRIYANHAVSLKRADRTEVTAPPNLWSQAQAEADAVEHALKALNITDKATINKAKAAKKIEFHVALYREQICPRFIPAS